MWFHARKQAGNNPGGITVSRTEELPPGEFGLTEYCWPGVQLWFVDEHEFTADEREEAYHLYLDCLEDQVTD